MRGGGVCVAWRLAEGSSVVVPGHGGHLVFVGILLVMLSLFWVASVVFVAGKG